jgi:hypothetical protein
VKKIGYKNLFERLSEGEREDETIRSFFFPEINIGLGMIIFRSMVDRGIKIMVVTDEKYSHELKEMGFGHAATIEEAMTGIQEYLPKANVAAALNAKVLITVARHR